MDRISCTQSEQETVKHTQHFLQIPFNLFSKVTESQIKRLKKNASEKLSVSGNRVNISIVEDSLQSSLFSLGYFIFMAILLPLCKYENIPFNSNSVGWMEKGVL